MVLNEKYGFKKGCIEVINQYRMYKIRKSGLSVEIFQIKCNQCGSIHTVEKCSVLRKESSYVNCKFCTENLKVGDKVGRLTLIESFIKHIGNNGTTNKFWTCKCECGNISYVSNSILRRERVYSCGKCKDIFRPTNSNHYNRALNIIKRCSNINSIDYPRYGGRGIANLLGNTIEEMIFNLDRVPNYQHGFQLDRIDNNGNYTIIHPVYGSNIWIDEYGNKCLGNLRWVTPQVNSNNRGSRKDFSRDLLLKLFYNFNNIDELRDFFSGTYLFNYISMFIFIPDDEVHPDAFRLVLFPHYMHIFERFITKEDENQYLTFVGEYVDEFESEFHKTSEIVQRLFL